MTAPAAPTVPVRDTGPSPPPPPGRRGWTGARVLSAVAGGLLVLVGLGLLTGGGVATWADHQRDGGYVTPRAETYSTDGYAVVSDRVTIGDSSFPWGWQSDLLGTVRLRVTSADAGRPLFVGIAPTAQAERYLSGVRRLTVHDLHGPDQLLRPGGAPAASPRSLDIWAVSTVGRGEQTLIWSVPAGIWTVVVMNADAGRGLTVTAEVGATLPFLDWLGGALLAAGSVLLLVGALLVLLAARRSLR